MNPDEKVSSFENTANHDLEGRVHNNSSTHTSNGTSNGNVGSDIINISSDDTDNNDYVNVTKADENDDNDGNKTRVSISTSTSINTSTSTEEANNGSVNGNQRQKQQRRKLKPRAPKATTSIPTKSTSTSIPTNKNPQITNMDSNSNSNSNSINSQSQIPKIKKKFKGTTIKNVDGTGTDFTPFVGCDNIDDLISGLNQSESFTSNGTGSVSSRSKGSPSGIISISKTKGSPIKNINGTGEDFTPFVGCNINDLISGLDDSNDDDGTTDDDDNNGNNNVAVLQKLQPKKNKVKKSKMDRVSSANSSTNHSAKSVANDSSKSATNDSAKNSARSASSDNTIVTSGGSTSPYAHSKNVNNNKSERQSNSNSDNRRISSRSNSRSNSRTNSRSNSRTNNNNQRGNRLPPEHAYQLQRQLLTPPPNHRKASSHFNPSTPPTNAAIAPTPSPTRSPELPSMDSPTSTTSRSHRSGLSSKSSNVNSPSSVKSFNHANAIGATGSPPARTPAATATTPIARSNGSTRSSRRPTAPIAIDTDLPAESMAITTPIDATPTATTPTAKSSSNRNQNQNYSHNLYPSSSDHHTIEEDEQTQEEGDINGFSYDDDDNSTIATIETKTKRTEKVRFYLGGDGDGDDEESIRSDFMQMLESARIKTKHKSSGRSVRSSASMNSSVNSRKKGPSSPSRDSVASTKSKSRRRRKRSSTSNSVSSSKSNRRQRERQQQNHDDQWETHWSSEHDCAYYHNKVTNAVTWENPIQQAPTKVYEDEHVPIADFTSPKKKTTKVEELGASSLDANGNGKTKETGNTTADTSTKTNTNTIVTATATVTATEDTIASMNTNSNTLISSTNSVDSAIDGLNNLDSGSVSSKSLRMSASWERYWSDEHACEYFHNPNSGETRWDNPVRKAMNSGVSVRSTRSTKTSRSSGGGSSTSGKRNGSLGSGKSYYKIEMNDDDSVAYDDNYYEGENLVQISDFINKKPTIMEESEKEEGDSEDDKEGKKEVDDNDSGHHGKKRSFDGGDNDGGKKLNNIDNRWEEFAKALKNQLQRAGFIIGRVQQRLRQHNIDDISSDHPTTGADLAYQRRVNLLRKRRRDKKMKKAFIIIMIFMSLFYIKCIVFNSSKRSKSASETERNDSEKLILESVDDSKIDKLNELSSSIDEGLNLIQSSEINIHEDNSEEIDKLEQKLEEIRRYLDKVKGNGENQEEDAGDSIPNAKLGREESASTRKEISAKKKEQKIKEDVIAKQQKEQKIKEAAIAKQKEEQKIKEAAIAKQKEEQKIKEAAIAKQKEEQKIKEAAIAKQKEEQRIKEAAIAKQKKEQKIKEDAIAKQKKGNTNSLFREGSKDSAAITKVEVKEVQKVPGTHYFDKFQNVVQTLGVALDVHFDLDGMSDYDHINQQDEQNFGDQLTKALSSGTKNSISVMKKVAIPIKNRSMKTAEQLSMYMKKSMPEVHRTIESGTKASLQTAGNLAQVAAVNGKKAIKNVKNTVEVINQNEQVIAAKEAVIATANAAGKKVVKEAVIFIKTLDYDDLVESGIISDSIVFPDTRAIHCQMPLLKNMSRRCTKGSYTIRNRPESELEQMHWASLFPFSGRKVTSSTTDGWSVPVWKSCTGENCQQSVSSSHPDSERKMTDKWNDMVSKVLPKECTNTRKHGSSVDAECLANFSS